MRTALLLGVAVISRCGLAQPGPPEPPLALDQTIPLPGVRGRIDHMDYDAGSGRLFVAALGNDSAEIVDVRAGTRLRSITGLPEPQGVAFVPNAKGVGSTLIVACGGDGAAHLFDPATFEPVKTVPLAPDADNIRRAWLDVYVGCGSGDSSAIARFSLSAADRAGIGRQIDRISLPGHPEGFALIFRPWPREDVPSAHPAEREVRLLANVPSAHEVAVIDLEQHKVVGHWPLKGAGGNFPMRAWQQAANTEGPFADRVVIGCRQPPQLLLLDAETGRQLATAPCAGDVDDLLLSNDHSRLFAVCGGDGGTIACYSITPETLQPTARIPTAPGARTGHEIGLDGREAFAIACPAHADRPAEIRIYRPTAPAHR
jgi:hypothetical protein